MHTAHTSCKGGNDWFQICRIGPGKFRTGPSFQDRSCIVRIDPGKIRIDPDKIRTDPDHAGPVRGSQTRFCPFLTVILNHRCSVSHVLMFDGRRSPGPQMRFQFCHLWLGRLMAGKRSQKVHCPGIEHRQFCELSKILL